MSPRGERFAFWSRVPLLFASAVWQMWWRRPERRPVMVGLAAVPLLLFAWMLASPAEMRPAQAAPPSPHGAAPPVPTRAAYVPPVPGKAPLSDDFKIKNPFRIKKDRTVDTPPPPPPPTQVVPAPPPAAPPINVDTRFKLLGTYLMGSTRYAIINVISKSREDVFKEGDQPLPGSRITKITPRKVSLIVDGTDATIEIDYSDWGGGKSQAAAPQQPSYMPPPQEGLAQPAPPAPDGQPKRLARAEVDGYLDNLNTLLTQVNIQPVFQAGQPAGFRLTDIQKGTILDQIGVSDGDTLRFVNGQRIDSVQSAFQLYNILKESTNVEITVIRNTRPVTLRYLIY